MMQIMQLRTDLAVQLSQFLNELKASGEGVYFSPHESDPASIERLALKVNLDQHWLVFYEGQVIAYGLLRGWDEGYAVPSLGIAVSQAQQGYGIGHQLMNWLHLYAKLRGATHIRLRVHRRNIKARKMYEQMNYVFSIDSSKSDFLLGMRAIEGAS